MTDLDLICGIISRCDCNCSDIIKECLDCPFTGECHDPERVKEYLLEAVEEYQKNHAGWTRIGGFEYSRSGEVRRAQKGEGE